MSIWISIFLGGGLGSVLRYLITHYSLKMIKSGFPWGTFISNMLACFVLALSIVLLKDKLQEQPFWRYFIIVGFCGGFSTFSTFGFENYILIRNDQIMLGILNILVSVVLSFLIMLTLFKDFHFDS